MPNENAILCTKRCIHMKEKRIEPVEMLCIKPKLDAEDALNALIFSLIIFGNIIQKMIQQI